MAATVFMSYSHKDEALRDELEVQLAMLKRQGLIEVWHDRRLVAGDQLDWAINEELNSADVILLLVSPDFLASDYCYNIETSRALERHRKEKARVISVILRPCDWQHADFAEFLVAPKDGKAVTQWADRDTAFLDVAQSIRAAIEKIGLSKISGHARSSDAGPDQAVTSLSFPRSSNLRLKKEFSAADKDRFLLEGFEYIERFFQGSLDELKSRNPDIETRHRRIDANSFTGTIYRHGKKVAGCTIRLGGSLGVGITFSHGDDASSHSYNESLSVAHDDQKLNLRPMGFGFGGGTGQRENLSHEGAAEYLWAIFIRPLQGN